MNTLAHNTYFSSRAPALIAASPGLSPQRAAAITARDQTEWGHARDGSSPAHFFSPLRGAARPSPGRRYFVAGSRPLFVMAAAASGEARNSIAERARTLSAELAPTPAQTNVTF